MFSDFSHMKWLYQENSVMTIDGKEVVIYNFNHIPDKTILKKWAHHFRNYYCLDEMVDLLRNGTNMTRNEYFRDIKFPDKNHRLGRSTRVGDFSEILVADYMQFMLNYWIPDRDKYSRKKNRNMSLPGCDIIGIYYQNSTKKMDDVLCCCEVKGKYSGKSDDGRLEIAINDSAKDALKIAEELSSIKQRFLEQHNTNDALKIERFQNINDNPYTEKYISAAVLEDSIYDEQKIKKIDTTNYNIKANFSFIIIKISNFKQLINDLYESAANEA